MPPSPNVTVTSVTVVLPSAAGRADGGSWVYGLTAPLWAGLVRFALLPHVAWSVNSLCHVLGERTSRTDGTTKPPPCGPSRRSPSGKAGATSTTQTAPAPGTARVTSDDNHA